LISCLAATLLIVGSTGYDPWVDYDEDGKIDATDLNRFSKEYGTAGDPTKNVTVTNESLNINVINFPNFKVISFEGATFVNCWGQGDKLFLGIANAYNLSTDDPSLVAMRLDGSYEVLLTRTQFQAFTGLSFGETVAIYEAVNGDIFASTHPTPVKILKKPKDGNWEIAYSPSPQMKTCYGITADDGGYLYFTARTNSPAKRAIYRSTDKGESWTEVWSEATDWIFGIETHKNTVVAGASNAIIRSGNRGDDWSLAAVTGTVRTVKHIEGETWIAFCGASAKIFMSIDDGVTWFETENKLPESGGDVPAQSCLSPFGKAFVSLGRDCSVAYSKNLAVWYPTTDIFPGTRCRGVYATADHLYLGTFNAHGITPYYGEPYSGKLLIIPLAQLEPRQSPPPMLIWDEEPMSTQEYESKPIYCSGIEKQKFYIHSETLGGNFTIKVFDEGAETYREFSRTSIPANTLTEVTFTGRARLIKISFTPSAATTVSLWNFMEET